MERTIIVGADIFSSMTIDGRRIRAISSGDVDAIAAVTVLTIV